MIIKPIRTDADARDVLVTLIEACENKHHAFGPADPVETIKFRMAQQRLTPRDLGPFIGSSGRVSEVLNRKRPLSLRMAKQLHDGLRIPYESLLAGVLCCFGAPIRWLVRIHPCGVGV